MANVKFLYISDTEFGPTEANPTVDTTSLAGLSLSGNLGLSSGARVTGIPDVPSAGTDAVNQNYVDNAITGLKWKAPVDVLRLIGNATPTVINALTPSAGQAYVVTSAGTLTAGSLAVVAGDLVELDGTNWVKLEDGSGGFVADGVRAILSTVDALISPYTDATDDGKIIEFDGSSLTGTDTGDAVDGNAVLIDDTGNVGYYDNLGYVFEGTVPTGTWTQFTGAGTISAGDGLIKVGNTISVGNGDGIKVNADSIEVELASSNPGLQLTGTSPNKQLAALAGGSNGIVIGATGIEIEIDATPDTLKVDADGLGVTGLPSLFKINDVAVSANVTSANLGTLTAGAASNADSLHTHAITAVDEAKRVEDTHVNNTAVTAGRAVRWSSVNNQVIHADNATSANATAIGIARTGGAGDPGTSEIVKHGVCAGALTGATVNTPYFLGTAGALVLFASVPKPGRVVRMGFAINATDIDVQIMDFGQRGA